MRPRVFLSNSINFLCILGTLCQLLLSLRIHGTFHQLLSTFCASEGPSVHQQDLLSTSALFPCGCGSFRQIPSTFPSCTGHSVIIQCVRGTFHPIPSTSVQVLCLWDLLKTFRVATGHSVNFRQPSVRPRNNLLTFCASVGPSIKVCDFPCSRRNFRRLSVHPWDLLSTFPTFTGPSINFCQFSVHLGPSVNIPCVSGTFHQLSVHPQELHLTFRGTFRQLSVRRGTFLKLLSTFYARA